MTVRIRIARTAAERDALFRVRHRVYVEQGGYMPPRPDRRIYDRFDAFPTTTNLVALDGDRPIGGVRLAEPCAAGTPADEYFDFGPHLPPGARRVGSASMLCLDAAYRHRRRLTSCLCGMFYHLAVERCLSHVVAPCNPEIEPDMLATGYRRVAPVFRHASGVQVSPLVLDLRRMSERMARFVRAHGEAHLVHGGERAFCVAGETVVRAGEPARAAYVVLDGAAVARRCDGPRPGGRRLSPGDIIGDAALLAGRPHDATVVAATDLDLMVVDEGALRQQLCAAPERALALLEALGGRLLDALAGPAADPSGGESASSAVRSEYLSSASAGAASVA